MSLELKWLSDTRTMKLLASEEPFYNKFQLRECFTAQPHTGKPH
jgi:hypothetical protein